MSKTVQTLLQSAADEGAIGQMSLQALSLVDIGGAINAGMGMTIDNIKGDTLLLSKLIDDSGSIRFAGNTDIVRQSCNGVLDALLATKQKDSILATCRYINGTVLYPFVLLDQATRMTSANYNPNGGTPLFDSTLALLRSIIAKQQDFADNGQLARSAGLITSDGNDEGSRYAKAADCRVVIEDMLRSETSIIAAIGIDDGPKKCPNCGLDFEGNIYDECPSCSRKIRRTDFRKVFGEMGIPDNWILTPKNTPSEIRAAFQTFSQSAVKASQGGASFSQVAMGGFGV